MFNFRHSREKSEAAFGNASMCMWGKVTYCDFTIPQPGSFALLLIETYILMDMQTLRYCCCRDVRKNQQHFKLSKVNARYLVRILVWIHQGVVFLNNNSLDTQTFLSSSGPPRGTWNPTSMQVFRTNHAQKLPKIYVHAKFNQSSWMPKWTTVDSLYLKHPLSRTSLYLELNSRTLCVGCNLFFSP